MSIEDLPEELLIRIFRVLRDTPPCSHCWLSVTHVCQGWRQIALNAAELWTYIPYSGNADLIKAFVSRSKQAPLDIRNVAGRTKDETRTIMSILLPQTSRIHSMHLYGPHSVDLFLQYSFPEGAPLLRSLHLYPLAFLDERNDIPEICRQGIPDLRHLQLFSWPIRDVSALRGLMNPLLRSLKVHWPKAAQSVNVWISILTELPLLEELRLSVAVSTTTSTLEQETTSSVRLSRLMNLVILGAHPEVTVAMLQRIIPAENVGITAEPTSFSRSPEETVAMYQRLIPAANVGITAEPSSFSSSPDTSVVQLLEVLNQKLSPRRPTSLSLKLGEDTVHGVYDITLWAPPFGDDAKKRPGCATRNTQQILNLHLLEIPLAQDAVATLLCGMLSKTFSLSSLKVLALHTVYDPHMRGTQQLVASARRELFPQMKSLRVLSIDAADIDTALTQSLGNVGSSSTVPFPALEVLTIRHTPLKDTIDFSLLLQTLQLRKDAGYPISRVH
ncbi:hypothetical protein EIP86_008453, partial [Pleurotus ostreatoroseus]